MRSHTSMNVKADMSFTVDPHGVQEKSDEIIVKKGGTSNNDFRTRERYDRFPKLLINGASEAELEAALRNFTRRMFTSPRLKPALDAWLRGGS